MDGQEACRAGYEHHEGRDVDPGGRAASWLTIAEIEDWKDKFFSAGENALRARPRDEDGLKDEQIKKLKQKVGELVMDLDIMKEATKLRPFGDKTPDE